MSFRNEILAGVTLIREAIQSQNYDPGLEGWTINADGTAEFSDLTIRSSDGSGNTVTIANGVITIRNSLGAVVSTISQDGYKVWDNAGAELLAEVTLTGGSFNDPGFIARYVAFPYIYMFMGNGEIEWLNTQNSMFIRPVISMNSLAVEDDEISMTIVPGAYTNAANVPRVTIGTSALGNSEFRVDSRFGDDPDIKLDGSVTISGVDIGRGLKDYTARTSNTAAVTTTETVGITSASVTFEAGRAYRVITHGLLASTIAADIARTRTRRTGVAGTILMDSMATCQIPAANNNVWFDSNQVVINSTAADIADVLVVTYHRISGTGNVQMSADATNPAWIEIRDIGLASDYPSARAL